MKKALKIGSVCLGIAAVLVSTFCAAVFWYYAPYAANDRVYDIGAVQRDDVTVMTFNIRCYTPTDWLKQSWYYRAPLVVDTIAKQHPDIVAFQEVNPLHERYLQAHLAGYAFATAYRTDTGNKEGVMIAYATDAFELVDAGYFWISETPERESKDWGTAFPRVALYTTLHHRKTGRVCTVMNVHLDHQSAEARRQGMRVLLEQKAARGIASMILLGDLNDYDDSPMYEQATKGGLVDALTIADSTYTGTGATYQGYGSALGARRIDYFLLTPDLTVTSYAVADDTYEGVYPSDHFPLVIHLPIGA